MLLSRPGGDLVYSETGAQILGIALALIGIVGALCAQISMGASWRVCVELQVRGVDESYLLATHGKQYRQYSERVGTGRKVLRASAKAIL